MAYDTRGNMLTRTDAREKVTTFSYYPDGLLKSVTDPLQHQTSLTYDTYGNIETQQNHLLHMTTYGYDILSRQTLLTNPLGRSTHYEYNAAGLLLRVKDHNLVVVEERSYDTLGRLESLTDGSGGVTQYACLR